MKSLFKNWPVQLVAAVGLTVLGLLFFSQNRYDVYPFSRLAYTPAFALPLFVLVAWFTSRVIFPAWSYLERRQRWEILIIALVGMVAAMWLIPPPEADMLQQHHLIIEAIGKKGDVSNGTQVAIDELRYLNQREVPLTSIAASADWRLQGKSLVSQGAPGSRLEIQGNMPGGLNVFLRYSPDAGIVSVTWDGVTSQIDLYARESASMAVTLRGKGLLSLPPALAFLSGLIILFYELGIAALILAGLILLYRLAGKRAGVVVYWLVILGITALFLILKLSYLKSDQPHTMRDSLSYVLTSREPLQSARFWVGLRPFTLPLVIKWMRINTNNYLASEELKQMIRLQTYFSAVCWGLFAFSLTRVVRQRWLSAVLFGITLAFSLSVEVSLWDALLLSESLSFSLLVLMLASWVCMLFYLPNFRQAWLRWLLVIGSLLVTVLYSFGRDSNIYYSLMAVAVLAFFWLVNRQLARFRAYILVYGAAIVVFFFAQYLSMSMGNRWQVFMYDHLGMRILLDPEATRFFAEQGLPVSDRLMTITTMRGSQYQKLIDESPDLRPVRDWVNCCSKTTYIKYLLSNPLRTLSSALENWQPLLNSNLKGYRNPRNGITPLPQKLSALSNFIFPNSSWAILPLLFLSLTGTVIYLRTRSHPIWCMIAALALPILPMMYMIWLGEPMEIDRHAAQLAIQLRLAGWLSLPLLVEYGLRKVPFKTTMPDRTSQA
jgi:hypothetical protein